MAWTASAPITIDHHQAGASSPFNLSCTITLDALKTVANGGLVTNTSGYDIGFSEDPSGTISLKFQTTSYDATAGTWVGWVQLTGVSGSFDVVYYVVMGNPAISTDQSTSAAWDTGYKLVAHLDGDVLDSTSNANNGTNHSGTFVAGQIGQCISLNGSAYVDFGRSGSMPTSGPFTVEAWFKYTGTFVVNQFPTIASMVDDIAGGKGWWLGLGAPNGGGGTANRIYFTTMGTGLHEVIASATLTIGDWYSVVATWDGTNMALYINGVSQGSTLGDAGYSGAVANFLLGNAFNAGVLTTKWIGLIDEFRISNIARSAGYAKDVYNNIVSQHSTAWSSQLVDDYVSSLTPPPAPPSTKHSTLLYDTYFNVFSPGPNGPFSVGVDGDAVPSLPFTMTVDPTSLSPLVLTIIYATAPYPSNPRFWNMSGNVTGYILGTPARFPAGTVVVFS